MSTRSSRHDTPRADVQARRLLSLCILACLWLLPPASFAATRAGWVEQARLIPSGIDLKAKLDTGAKNSSVNAQSMAIYQVEGDDHVRFTIINKVGESVELSLPVVRYARIKRHFGKTQERPVVRLTICIGNLVKSTEVNLVDRAGFNYPLLIGRSFLAGEFLIDSAHTFTLTTTCEDRSAP